MIDSETSGTFHSPGWPNSYSLGSRCLFRFMAPPGRKILIEFAYFYVEGLYPYCHKDFLDIYIDVASSHPRNEDEVRFLAYLQEAQGLKTTTPFSALLFSSMLARSSLLGRFCGLQRDEGVNKLPQQFVSLYREVILDFFSAPSAKRISGRDKLGFNGTFKIIPDDIYYPGKVASSQDFPFLSHAFLGSTPKKEGKQHTVGAPEPTCRFVIQSRSDSEQQSGEFASPAYPGFHPPGLQCIYIFRGQPNQRIRMQIVDLNLPSQMNTCSTDYIQIFDGNDLNKATSIGNRICGEQKNLQIYSTESLLTIIFVTSSTITKHTYTKYRGFRIAYKFWDKFVPVAFDLKDLHVRGTECDFSIRSGVQKDGVLESPNFSFSALLYPSHVCTFYFLGRHEKQRLETVRVGFDFVDLPSFNTNEKKCSNGFLAIYGSRVENTDNFTLRPIVSPSFAGLNLFEENSAAPHKIASLPQPSQIWCGDKLNAIKTKDDVDSSAIISLRSALVLRFNASGKSPMNVQFRVYYKFVSDFGIPGIMATPKMCWFTYKGSDYRDGQIGWTNSPFYADTYPPNSNCLYLFKFEPEQSILLSFTSFQTKEETLTRNSHFHKDFANCKEDYLEVIELLNEITHEGRLLQKFANSNQKKWTEHAFNDFPLIQIKEYRKTHSICGDYIPGPLIPSPSAKHLLLAFRSDDRATSTGFQLKFQFLPRLKLFPRPQELCISDEGNVTEFGGVLQSPNYPNFYPKSLNCERTISVNEPAQGILLQFLNLSVEGTTKECKNAVVRIKEGDSLRSVSSICGFASVVPAYVSKETSITISMVTNENAHGANGFKIVWTKLLPLGAHDQCHDFLCTNSHHCIPKELECNGFPNCGTYIKDGHILTDNSDETTNCKENISSDYLHIGLGVLLTLVMLACVIVYIVYREKKRQRKKIHDPLDVIPGDDEDEINLYSPLKSPPLPSSKEKLLVEPTFHTCKHLTKAQLYSSSLSNGTIGDMSVHQRNSMHHDEPHFSPSEISNNIPCGHSSTHSLKSGLSVNSPIVRTATPHCSACPCGHTLIISSPPVTIMQASSAHNLGRASSRRTSFNSNGKEKMQKISIV